MFVCFDQPTLFALRGHECISTPLCGGATLQGRGAAPLLSLFLGRVSLKYTMHEGFQGLPGLGVHFRIKTFCFSWCCIGGGVQLARSARTVLGAYGGEWGWVFFLVLTITTASAGWAWYGNTIILLVGNGMGVWG